MSAIAAVHTRPPLRAHPSTAASVGRALLLGALALVSLAPLLVLVVRALGTTWRFPSLAPDEIDGAALAALVSAPRLRGALWASVTLAVASGAGAVGLGFVAARALARTTGWVRRVGAMAAFLPVVAPPIALGVGLQVAALGAGVAGRWVGVFLAHLVPATGYVTLYFLGVLTAYDAGAEEAARTLGATPRQVLWRVTLPLLRARLSEGALLGALVSWGQLALSLVVGAGAVRTLPIELLSSLRAGDDRAGAAASLALAVIPALGLLLTRLRWRAAGAPP